MATKEKTIGFGLPLPKVDCKDDRYCPFHGEDRNIRGRSFTATVIRSKVQKCAIVERTGKRYVPKYERYAKTRTRLMVHNPRCINAQEGDRVLVYETRKISKRKNSVIVQKITE